ncbi:hypothetical protein AMECASPLE_035322 [Ameca splendens]|uniref:Uncharacterized protein n=1 Tax=Ameca splendens TaxID=208324 RepID=A0ABV0YUF5_9TELE
MIFIDFLTKLKYYVRSLSEFDDVGAIFKSLVCIINDVIKIIALMKDDSTFFTFFKGKTAHQGFSPQLSA